MRNLRSPCLVVSVLCSFALGLAACGGSGDNPDLVEREGGLDGGLDAAPEQSDAELSFPDADQPDVENQAPPEGCGDGVREPDSEEQCDDGNTQSGDGCDARCQLEVGFNCDPNGGPCMPVCGDGLLAGSEACDDANSMPGDGCGQTCEIEAGWGCPVASQLCEPALCGDGIEVGDEQCDYGDSDNGDGCSATCQIEPGWVCGGGLCTAAACGDGIRVGAEVCDDGNEMPGDGCSATCDAAEPFHVCPVNGGACLKITECGDGTFTADEGCDDGNLESGDGCSATCVVETGYTCPGGALCAPICGDGLVRGTEQCDDAGNAAAGCSATCQLEPGYHCPAPGQACRVAVCGNGIVEGLEQCDDGAVVAGVVVPDNELGDGCTPACVREPRCPNGICEATCGDGIVGVGEACDDGNNRNGDGCRGDCSAFEPGFSCTNIAVAPPPFVDLPLVLRDFKTWNTPQGHPDFNRHTGDEDTVLVRDALGVDMNNNGIPDSPVPAGRALSVVYARNAADGSDTGTTHGAAAFNQWYRDSVRGKTVVSTLRVTADPQGTYVFDDRTFYPLDGRGWQDASCLLPGEAIEASFRDGSNSDACDANNHGDPQAGQLHNFGFTSEVRFWFTYQGDERLRFRGDDDVWVFMNGRKVIDLGGVHCAEEQTVLLRNGDGVVSGVGIGNGTTDTTVVSLGLVVGRVYEVVVFQAERHTEQSSYRLELGKFFSSRTECAAICGDGIRTAGELCDSGGACVGGSADTMRCSIASTTDCPGGTCVSLNDGGYGRCGPDCTARGPYCGDAMQQTPPEACDLGALNNSGAYGPNGCNPDCTPGPRCGDMQLNASFGENCDQGPLNADNTYGVCSTMCKLGPRCGDGIVQTEHGEECDDRINKAAYDGCAPGCRWAPSCGDGVVQALQGEACDLGLAMNSGSYGGCNADCSRASFCGDGAIDREDGEACDDGNANSFDGCSAACQIEQGPLL